MRRVPIRLKLAAALSIPLIALGVVTILEVLKSGDEVRQIRAQTDLAEAAIGPSGLITSLQNERTWAALDLVGYAGMVTIPVEGYDETRTATNTAIDQFRARITTKGDAVAAAYQPALDGLGELEQLRADIDANVAAVNPRTTDNNGDFSQAVFERATALIEPFFDATTRIALAIDDPELRQGTELADAATRQIEVLSLLASGIIRDATTSEGGLNTPAEISRAASLHASFLRNAETMLAGTGEYADIAASSFPVAITEDINEQVDKAIATSTVDVEVMLAVLDVPEDESFMAYQEAVAAQIEERSDELNDAAAARQRWFIALAVLVLATALVLTWLVSRSITRPLRSLTRQARDMAERRLPDAVIDILETPLGDDVSVPSIEPVRLNTRDEVADVSAALNTVQDTALDLAVEQAVLRRNIADSFVNLGRRNQNLLGRQLDFITELETNETDPDTLANLFRLDHLATRMRRNAESLLVLAGIEPPRKWAAPVRLTDVIRAALGEVEDYQRVTVRGVEPATIIGNAAADLAHLLAELTENALVFSPPDQTVDIRGRNRPATPGHEPGYTLAIIDSGLGMPPTDVTAANRRLAGAESFTIAPSKYLGHYVAGNLAARHNIHVHLDNSPGNGITATIDIPPTLLTTDNAAAHADEPHAAREVWPPAPTISAPDPAPLAPAPAPLPSYGAATDRGVFAEHQSPLEPPLPAAFPRADFVPPPAAPPYGVDASGPWADNAGGGSTWPAMPMAPSADAPASPLGGGLARRRPSSDADAEARRTPSGLVKRTPRVVDTGEMPVVGRGPNDDLLASLSRYTNGRHPTGAQPVVDTPTAPRAAAPPPLTPRSRPAPAAPPAAPPQTPSSPFSRPRRPQAARVGSPPAWAGCRRSAAHNRRRREQTPPPVATTATPRPPVVSPAAYGARSCPAPTPWRSGEPRAVTVDATRHARPRPSPLRPPTRRRRVTPGSTGSSQPTPCTAFSPASPPASSAAWTTRAQIARPSAEAPSAAAGQGTTHRALQATVRAPCDARAQVCDDAETTVIAGDQTCLRTTRRRTDRVGVARPVPGSRRRPLSHPITESHIAPGPDPHEARGRAGRAPARPGRRHGPRGGAVVARGPASP